jgi:phage-related minor tail protein
MAGSVIGEALVDIKAGTSGFLSGIQGAMGQAEGMFSNMGSNMSSKMTGVGGIMTAGLTAPILAVGAFAIESSVQVDGAMNRMIRKTNETGAEADKTKASFKKVFADVPEDADKVATAMATVHNRLGLTGTDLEGVTKKGIELARMMGTDVNTTVENSAKIFEAWHTPANQVSGDMDKLYVVATKTGVPVDQISQALSKVGAQASAANVPMDSVTAAVGSLAAGGVPARQGVSIISEAIAKLQKEGKDAGVELPAMLQRIANGTATAADKALLGEKNYGKLSGSLGDAKNGYNALKTAQDNSSGAIDKQAKDTESFSDKLKTFKNDLMLAFEPLGKVIIKVFSEVLTAAKPILSILTTIMTAFSTLPGPIQMVIVVIGGILAAIGPLLMILPALAAGFAILSPIVMGIAGAVMAISLPVLLIVGAVILLGVLLYLLYTRFKPFHDAVDQVVGWIKLLLGDLMSGDFGKLGEDFKKGILGALDVLKKFDWGKLGSDLRAGIIAALATFGAWLWAQLAPLGGQLWGAIIGALASFGTWLWGLISNLPMQLWNAYVSIWTQIGTWLWGFLSPLPGQLWNGIVSALGSFGSWLLGLLPDIGGTIWTSITNALGNLGSWLANLFTQAHIEFTIPVINQHVSFNLAGGGMVKARPGGVLAVIGEGGEDEYVLPKSKLGDFGAIASIPQMGGGGFVSGGAVSSFSSSTAKTSDGGIVFQAGAIQINNPTLTSIDEADKLGQRIGYKANEMMRRAGHTRG